MVGDASEPGRTRVDLMIESNAKKVADARREVEALSAVCGFDEASRGEIGLCVNEALANIIRHAYRGAPDRPIRIQAECTDETLRIAIRDWGSGVNPERVPCRPHDPLKPGGVGLLCLRELMDEVTFTPQPDGMLLVMMRGRNRVAGGGERARDAG